MDDLFFRRRKALDYEQFKINAENQNKQYELMSGITDIKLNAYENYKMEEWRALQERSYRMSVKMLKLGQIQNTGFTLIGQLRNIFITCWIAVEVVNGRLTLGMMMSISAIIGLVNGPLSQLIGFLQQFQDAKSVWSDQRKYIFVPMKTQRCRKTYRRTSHWILKFVTLLFLYREHRKTGFAECIIFYTSRKNDSYSG